MQTNKRSGFNIFHAQDRYVDEILAAQERQLEDLQKDPETRAQEELMEKRKEMLNQELSAGERWSMVGGAVAAGLVVAGIFVLVFFLFLLFCTKVLFV
ncbi:MAG: hypothetical protein IJ324_10260 [Lachnospiraceae bacterium]|nr:hypothetical protein [Lachnospiraceae bacterium]